MTEYNGPLVLNKMPYNVRKIYMAWRCQRDRCYNAGARSYRWWGKKGIRVKYSSRDFINWYLKESKKFNHDEDIVVSRIDHNGHYEFRNIKLETRSENSIEAFNRNKSKMGRNIQIVDIKTNSTIATVFGTIEAEKVTGINRGNISRYLSGEYKTSKKYKFVEV